MGTFRSNPGTGFQSDRGPLSLGSNEAGGGYTAKAVHFDGLTWLINAALASSDNGTASFSAWLKCAAGLTGSSTFWVSDPVNNYLQWASPGVVGTVDGTINFDDGAGGTIFQGNLTFPVGSYLNVLGSVDAQRSPPVFCLYFNDIVRTIMGGSGLTGASVLPFNGLPYYIGQDDGPAPADSYIGDMADLWIAPGISLLDGSGDIPLATRRKFIDALGKPVFLGANGELATGTAPAVFLSGDASTFATNLGTGGAFATTGTLTDATGP